MQPFQGCGGLETQNPGWRIVARATPLTLGYVVLTPSASRERRHQRWAINICVKQRGASPLRPWLNAVVRSGLATVQFQDFRRYSHGDYHSPNASKGNAGRVSESSCLCLELLSSVIFASLRSTATRYFTSCADFSSSQILSPKQFAKDKTVRCIALLSCDAA